MTNETTSTATAVLSLIAAFEAERSAMAARVLRLEELVFRMEDEIASLHRMVGCDAEIRDGISGRIDFLSSQITWLDKRFEDEASGIASRLAPLEVAERIRAEFDGPALDKADGLESRLDEIERAAERLESRVDDLENQNNDDEAIREAVERVLDGASLSISI